MKLQRIFICIVGVFSAVGFAASQAVAGTGVPGCGDIPGGDPMDPMGFMEIDVNTLRAGGKTIVTSPNNTTKVTTKARILKGTAPGGTTINTTITIEAIDGTTVIGTASSEFQAVTIGVGGGGLPRGQASQFDVSTEQCESGVIRFVAKFTGVDSENDVCVGEKIISKECR
jgi:hypothetical protein